jgi:hypothetical protein
MVLLPVKEMQIERKIKTEKYNRLKLSLFCKSPFCTRRRLVQNILFLLRSSTDALIVLPFLDFR